MGTIKDRNCMDLREAEDIKKRGQVSIVRGGFRRGHSWERLEISSRKLEIPREHFILRWA